MFEPSAPPSDPSAVAYWAADEFAKLARLYGDGYRIHFVQPSYAAPDKPREGMLVHADGTVWDPGSGAGTYAYIGGSWVYLPGGGGSASDSFATIAVSGQSDVVADSSSDTLTLVAGTGIAITTNAAADSITVAATGAANAFSTIAVSGQSNVVADSATDTLTLAAGSNVTITTNATTDTVTIASTGGAPAGSDTEVQFNDGGVFGADAQFTWDKTNNILTIGNLSTGATVRSAPVSGNSDGVRLLIQASNSSGTPSASGGALDLVAGNSVSTVTGAGGPATLTPGDGITGGDGIIKSGAGNASTGSSGHIKLSLNATGLNKGNIYTRGTGVELATSATGGFFEIPTCSGTPTGAPALTLTGNAPIIADTANNRLWLYLNAAWRGMALATTVNPQESMQIACSDETTALTTGTAKVTFRNPYNVAITIDSVRASLTTAQASGSILTVDINEAGTTILSTKLTIDNTEKTSVTAATAAVISDASIAANAEMTIDIDQVGDGTAAGLKVVIEYHR